MRFDESQAKGLKNYLLKEMELQICEALEAAEKNISSSNGWSNNHFIRVSNNLKEKISKFTISNYTGHRNNKRYIAFSQIEVSEKRKYNTWEEDCLFSNNILLTQKLFELQAGSYNISEHTITRIFQRLKFPDNFDTKRDIFWALQELKYLPAYTAYWNRFAYFFTSVIGIKKFDLTLPAPNGIFIAEIIDPKIPMVEIRTYLTLEMLSEKQLRLRKLYIDAVKDLFNSPLPFFLILEAYSIDSAELEVKILSSKLSPYFEEIFDQIIIAEDATLGYEWSIDMLKELMQNDAIHNLTILDQLPFHPLKRESIVKKFNVENKIELEKFKRVHSN